MKIGLSLPNNWGLDDPFILVRLAALADALQFDSIWVSEHLLNISYVEQRIGDKPYYHPLALLAFIAARTETITLGTSVLVLPFHHPVELAKFAATLDGLSKGRLVLGIGVGAIPEEFAALGIDYHRRGSITDESISVMTALWREAEATHHGTIWSFDRVKASPKPVQKPSIPLWVGGGPSAAVFRRAATIADGWHASGLSREEFAVGAAAVRRLAQEAGRRADDITMSIRVNIDYGQPLPNENEHKTLIPSANPAQMAEEISEWRKVGVNHIVLALNLNDVIQLEDEIRRIASEILPLLRSDGSV